VLVPGDHELYAAPPFSRDTPFGLLLAIHDRFRQSRINFRHGKVRINVLSLRTPLLLRPPADPAAGSPRRNLSLRPNARGLDHGGVSGWRERRWDVSRDPLRMRERERVRERQRRVAPVHRSTPSEQTGEAAHLSSEACHARCCAFFAFGI
jgi:hypothetical protein